MYAHLCIVVVRAHTIYKSLLGAHFVPSAYNQSIYIYLPRCRRSFYSRLIFIKSQCGKIIIFSISLCVMRARNRTQWLRLAPSYLSPLPFGFVILKPYNVYMLCRRTHSSSRVYSIHLFIYQKGSFICSITES